MTIAIDTSAFLKRYVAESGRHLVNSALADDSAWCSSAFTRTEVQLALHRMASNQQMQESLWASFRSDWDKVAAVPLDNRCLARSIEIGARFDLRTVDALHLAAADRLPKPLKYLTFDSHQIPAALSLGFEVISQMTS
ncbi:MAG TPA: hypothetical protein DCP89_02505 [Acidimicrobiaceae bacterium]|jgi:hypothetical protein|nr:hypothetical protein [Actinomycetota bacterium]HAN07351.1 hypothetical protein [Acidimicrobiaceae bacterium]|tara:strand:+ start:107 stop:520 length:414 start_codon:yes stop_codon:yes gene_type:complete